MSLLRPKAHAINQIISMILNDTYPAGSVLPAERVLAGEIGVTRQTVREVLQRLDSEGWITIQHGKPTIVNDYWQKGGQGILSSIAKFAEEIPLNYIKDLMEVRAMILPGSAESAANRQPEIILNWLSKAKGLENTTKAYVEFDWGLQCLIAQHSGNRIVPLMMNDYAALFDRIGSIYFSLEYAREMSMQYYLALTAAVQQKTHNIEEIVKNMLLESIEILKLTLKQNDGGSAPTL